jgi:hypothetical protein
LAVEPGVLEITEVLVDAKTGAIVSVDRKSPAQQVAEAKTEKQ